MAEHGYKVKVLNEVPGKGLEFIVYVPNEELEDATEEFVQSLWTLADEVAYSRDDSFQRDVVHVSQDHKGFQEDKTAFTFRYSIKKVDTK